MFVRPGTTILTAFLCLVTAMPASGVVRKRGTIASSDNGAGQATECFFNPDGTAATPLLARMDGHAQPQTPTKECPKDPQITMYTNLANSITVNSNYTLTLTPILWLNGPSSGSRSILEVKLTANALAPIPSLTLQTLVLKGQLNHAFDSTGVDHGTDPGDVACSLPSTPPPSFNENQTPNGASFGACMTTPELVLKFPQLDTTTTYSDTTDLFLLEPDVVVDSVNKLTVVDFSTMNKASDTTSVAYLGLPGVPSGALTVAKSYFDTVQNQTQVPPPDVPVNALDVSTVENFHAVLVDASGNRTEVGGLALPYPACAPAGTTCPAPPNDSANTPTSVNSENFTDFIDVTNATVQDDSDPKSKSGCYSGDPSLFDPLTHTELIDFRTVWYKLNAQGAGSMDISTDESRFDTRIDVFQSATKPDASAASFACDDDFGPANGPSQLQAKLQGVPVAAQQTYWIMISEAAKPSGTLLNFDATSQTEDPEPAIPGPFVTGPIPFASSAVLNVSIKTVGLDSDKSTLTFVSQTVNTTSPSQRITLTAQNGTVGSIVATPAGDFSVSANTCTTVASGGTCTIDVKFTPTAAGSRAGSLQITSNAVLGPINVSLSGVGQGSSGATLSTNTLAFGDQLVGTTSAAQTVTLTNSGTATLNISGLSIASGPFAIASGSSCQGLATLASGGTCTVKVTYTPSAVGAAPATSLSIVDDASNSPQTVSLTGTGTDFTVTGSTPGTPSATVPAGQPATYNLLLAPVSGFTGTVTMACDAKTLPSATSCTFNPAAPTLGATATQVMLTIGTTARTRALQGSSGLGLMTSGFVSVFGMLLCSRRTRRSVPLKWCMGLFFLGLLWTGCGGNSAPPVNPQNSGTPAGTYSVKVSGSAAGHTSAPLTVSLTVQ